jgi:hypothetical protein
MPTGSGARGVLGSRPAAIADAARRATRPAAAAARRAWARVLRLPVWAVLAALLLCQWAVVGIVAAIAFHNGVVYYTGGDDTWYFTTAWVLAHAHVPQGAISYGYPALIAPLVLITGANALAGLPLIIAFNLLVLWPLALICVYGISKAIAGRGFAYVASLAWTVFPLLSIPYFYGRYHVRYVDQTLPAALGLTATGDFPSMVFVLVAAYFALKAVSERSLRAALLAGLAAGFAATVKPANLIFLPAPLVALLVARRWRELLLFGAGVAPALAGLALWKYRGLGQIPAFSSPSATLASGPRMPPLASLDVGRYVRLDWHHLWHNMFGIREYTKSLRLVTWALAAGAIALARRSLATMLVLSGWLLLFIVLKGTSSGVDVISGSFFRSMVPAFPPFFFGIVAIPLLVPVFGRRLIAAGRSERYWPAEASRRTWQLLFGAAAVLLAVPILAIAAFRPLTAPDAAEVPAFDQYVPTNVFPLQATVGGDGSVLLRWPSQDRHGSRAGYNVFRTPTDGLRCVLRRHAAALCTFYTDYLNSRVRPLVRTARTSFRDHPPAGTWVYRVAATTSPGGPAGLGNFMAMSRAARVTVRPY